LNAVFHGYYQQLEVSIESFSHITPRTFHQCKPLAKFHVDPHFIYMTAHKDERKEELQSYYKLKNEEMEQIMKEWPEEFQTPIDDTELSKPDIIGIPLVTQFENSR
jgi:hypothetical protein